MTKFTHLKEKVCVAPANRGSNLLMNSSNKIYFFPDDLKTNFLKS